MRKLRSCSKESAGPNEGHAAHLTCGASRYLYLSTFFGEAAYYSTAVFPSGIQFDSNNVSVSHKREHQHVNSNLVIFGRFARDRCVEIICLRDRQYVLERQTGVYIKRWSKFQTNFRFQVRREMLYIV